jgi:hypothetical protein
MRHQLLLIAALLAVGMSLAAFIYLYEVRHKARTEQTVEESKKFLTVPRDSVEELRVRTQAEDFTLAKSAQGWVVVQPLTVPAKREEVERLLERLLDVKKVETLGRNPAPLVDYGLHPAHVEISLWTRNHTPAGSLLFGDRSPDRTNVYVLSAADSLVCLAAGDILFAVEKKLFDLRDRDLCGFERDTIAKLEVVAGPAAPVVLKREADRTWTIVSPVIARARRTEVDRMLDKLVYNKADEIAAEEAPALKPYGLDPARIRVTAWDQENNMTTLLIGNPIGKDNTSYAKRVDRRAVYVVGQTVREGLDQTLASLRDTVLAAFAPENVNSVKVTVQDTVYACSRGADNTWRLEKPRPVAGADADNKINELIEALNGLAWKSIVSDQPANPAQYGLAAGARKVEIWFNQGQPVTLLFGSVGNVKENLRYCRLEPGKSVYLVPGAVVEKIGAVTSLK